MSLHLSKWIVTLAKMDTVVGDELGRTTARLGRWFIASTRVEWLNALWLGAITTGQNHVSETVSRLSEANTRAALKAFVCLRQSDDKRRDRFLANLFDARKVGGHDKESRVQRRC
jgi:hypothetical protein